MASIGCCGSERKSNGCTDIWMALAEKVRDLFLGLQIETDLMQHRETVLQLMGDNSAVCAVRGKDLIGILLFSRDEKELCFLAVVRQHRRQHIARPRLVAAAMTLPLTKARKCEEGSG